MLITKIRCSECCEDVVVIPILFHAFNLLMSNGITTVPLCRVLFLTWGDAIAHPVEKKLSCDTIETSLYGLTFEYSGQKCTLL